MPSKPQQVIWGSGLAPRKAHLQLKMHAKPSAFQSFMATVTFPLSIPSHGPICCCCLSHIPAETASSSLMIERDIYSPVVSSRLQAGIYLTAAMLLWRFPGCCWPRGLFNRTYSISPQIKSGPLFPFPCLFVRPDGISGNPAVWKGTNKWVLFKEGCVATWRNYNPGSVRSSAEIRWLGSREHGAARRGREVWGKGI